MARPSDYNEEIGAAICARLAAGEPLVKICRDEEMPGVSSVYRWLIAQEKFREMYTRAREDQADTLADEIIDIADADPASVFSTEGHGENEVDVQRVDSAAVAHQRLRVDARKWIAAKLKPRKYGDKLEHSGKVEGGFALNVNLSKAA
jgi:hypothetical protein